MFPSFRWYVRHGAVVDSYDANDSLFHRTNVLSVPPIRRTVGRVLLCRRRFPAYRVFVTEKYKTKLKTKNTVLCDR